MSTTITNPGDAKYRHLANYRNFDVKQSILDYRKMLKDTAQYQCAKDLGVSVTALPCKQPKDWLKHEAYDKYLNIIFFPSDMSGDATRVINNGEKNDNNGTLKSNTNLQNDLASMIPSTIVDAFAPTDDPFKNKITYVLIVHQGNDAKLLARVQWLKERMEAKKLKVLYKEVDSVRSYENYFNTKLLTLFKESAAGGKKGKAIFNNMRPEYYKY